MASSGNGGGADPSRDGMRPGPALGLLIVAALSCYAGAVDACGYAILKDLFVSFMSGNTTSLGAAIAHRDLSRALLIAAMVATFVAGAAAGTVLATAAGRRHLTVVVLFVSAVLAVPLPVPLLVPAVVPAAAAPVALILPMVFAMGALNAAMDHAGAVGVSITYITGTLVKLGRGLGRLLCGRSRDLDWLEQAVPWLGILSGSLLATLALVSFGSAVLVALPAVGLVLAAAIFALTRGREDAAA